MDPRTRGILDYADNVVCAIFFCGFLAAWFIGPSTSPPPPPPQETNLGEELAALRAEVAGLRQELAKPREGTG